MEQLSVVLNDTKLLFLSVFDVDNFKDVNDELDRLVGDQVLQDVIKILANDMRETDFLGRWGGEEFITIMENIDKNGAAIFAEKLRSEIKAYFKKENYQMPVTVSVGVTNCKDNDNDQGIFDRADIALYKSIKAAEIV